MRAGNRVVNTMAVFFAILVMALTLMAVDVLGQNRDTVVFSDQQSCTTIGKIGGATSFSD